MFSSPTRDAPRGFPGRKWIPNPPQPLALPWSPSQLGCSWPLLRSHRRICRPRISHANGGIDPDARGGAGRIVVVDQTAFGCFHMIRGQAVGDRSELKRVWDRLKRLRVESHFSSHIVNVEAYTGKCFTIIPTPFQQL